MSLTTTTALCLRKVHFSETSQILTLLTDKLGIVGAIAKGAKRAKSSIGGPLDLMCLYNTVLYDRSKRGSLSILAQAELLDFYPGARSTYAAFLGFERLRELLLSIEVSAADGAPTLLVAVKALRAIAGGAEPEQVLARFSWDLLGVMGLEPIVTHCVVSGTEPSGRVQVTFSLHEMGLISPPHNELRPGLVKVSARALRALMSLATDTPVANIPVDAWRGASTLLAWLVAMQGGRRLRTFPMLEPSRPL